VWQNVFPPEWPTEWQNASRDGEHNGSRDGEWPNVSRDGEQNVPPEWAAALEFDRLSRDKWQKKYLKYKNKYLKKKNIIL
jgi:hypothetical protein